jgi:hypothetical protein
MWRRSVHLDLWGSGYGADSSFSADARTPPRLTCGIPLAAVATTTRMRRGFSCRHSGPASRCNESGERWPAIPGPPAREPNVQRETGASGPRGSCGVTNAKGTGAADKLAPPGRGTTQNAGWRTLGLSGPSTTDWPSSISLFLVFILFHFLSPISLLSISNFKFKAHGKFVFTFICSIFLNIVWISFIYL